MGKNYNIIGIIVVYRTEYELVAYNIYKYIYAHMRIYSLIQKRFCSNYFFLLFFVFVFRSHPAVLRDYPA